MESAVKDAIDVILKEVLDTLDDSEIVEPEIELSERIREIEANGKSNWDKVRIFSLKFFYLFTKLPPDIFTMMSVLLIIQYLSLVEAYVSILLAVVVALGTAGYKIKIDKVSKQLEYYKNELRKKDIEMHSLNYKINELEKELILNESIT